MNPVTKTAVATIQKVGRKLSYSYANNSRNGIGIGRVAELIGSVRSTHSQEPKQQTTIASGTPLTQLSEQVSELAKAQRRTKSSLAIEYDEPEEAVTAAALANATYDQSVREPFPSIVLGPGRSVEPQGSFAEAQAEVRKMHKICAEIMKRKMGSTKRLKL
jgi:hypothetical protein